MELTVKPVEAMSTGGSCEIAFEEKVDGQLSAEMKEAVENGVHSSYLQGNIQLNSFILFFKVPEKSALADNYI